MAYHELDYILMLDTYVGDNRYVLPVN